MFSSVKNFLITFFVSIVIFGVIAYFVVNFAMDTIAPVAVGTETNDSGETENTDIGAPGAVTSDGSSVVTDDNGNIIEGETTAPEPSDLSEIAGKTFTALLIGTDYLPSYLTDYEITEKTDGFPVIERTISADSMLLIRIDKENARVMYSSIPADMQVLVDGVYTRLGSLYSSKGVEFMKNKVTAVTGLGIDYYAVLHVQDFSKIIDIIGGIQFDVPVSMNYTDSVEGLTISIDKGLQTLDGDTAEKMLRYVSYSDGNVSRMNLTVNFAKAIMEKLTSPDYMTNAASLYQKFTDYVNTNFTESALTENLELIYAYPSMTTSEITYPGSVKISNGTEYFDPSLTSAISLYGEFRAD